MTFKQAKRPFACLCVVALLSVAACKQAQTPAAKQEKAPAVTQGAPQAIGEDATLARSPSPSTSQFLQKLALGEEFKVVETRKSRTKRGKAADVVLIDYSKGSVRDVSKSLREKMKMAGMKLVGTSPTRGGQRLRFSSDDALVSLRIRSKKYAPGISADAAGRIALTYVAKN